jgi:hypothetical protein
MHLSLDDIFAGNKWKGGRKSVLRLLVAGAISFDEAEEARRHAEAERERHRLEAEEMARQLEEARRLAAHAEKLKLEAQELALRER